MPSGTTGPFASGATGVAVLEISLLFLVSLLFGIAGMGLRRQWRVVAGTPTPPSLLATQLMLWGVLHPGDPTANDVYAVVRAAITRVQSYPLFGIGITLGLFGLGYLGVGIVSGRLVPPDVFLGGPGGAQALLFLLLVLGFIGGHLVGLRQSSIRRRPGVSYGDLRRRRLRDYRSPLFLYFSGLIVVLHSAAALVVALHLAGTLPLAQGLAYSALPLGALTLVLCPAALLVTMLSGELLLSHVVHEPRVLLVADPATAQRADDLLRGLSLTLIQGSVLVIIAGLGQLQWRVLNGYLGALSEPLSVVAFCASYPLFLLGLATFGLRGRLGGTVTGWAWTREGMHDGAAAARP